MLVFRKILRTYLMDGPLEKKRFFIFRSSGTLLQVTVIRIGRLRYYYTSK